MGSNNGGGWKRSQEINDIVRKIVKDNPEMSKEDLIELVFSLTGGYGRSTVKIITKKVDRFYKVPVIPPEKIEVIPEVIKVIPEVIPSIVVSPPEVKKESLEEIKQEPEKEIPVYEQVETKEPDIFKPEKVENIPDQDPRDPDYNKPVFDVPIRMERKPIENLPAVFERIKEPQKKQHIPETEEEIKEEKREIARELLRGADSTGWIRPRPGDPNFEEVRRVLWKAVDQSFYAKYPELREKI